MLLVSYHNVIYLLDVLLKKINQILKEIKTISINIFNLHLMTQMRFTISQMQNITENTKLKYLPFG